MKSIFKYISIPIVIIFLLLSCVSFSAFAVDDNEPPLTAPHVMFDDFSFNEGENYIWYYTRTVNANGTAMYNAYFYHLPDDAVITEDNGIITFSNPNHRQFSYVFRYVVYNKDQEFELRTDTTYTRTDGTIKTLNTDTEIFSGDTSPYTSARYTAADISFDSDLLDVEVSFSPALVGVVDREINNNGVKSYMSELRMTVINHCNYPIQYKMDITAKEQSNTRPSTSSANLNTYYSDDAVFKYYKENWVWNKSGLAADPNDSSDLGNDWSDVPIKYNKASEWHYLGARDTQNQTFKYTQINLREGVEYVVTVYACRCDYDMATENIVDDCTTASVSDLMQIDNSSIQIVYCSEFSMLHYSDVVYNPNDTSNGVLPYNGYDGASPSQKYDNSYNAWELIDGEKSYKSYDALPSYSPGGYSSGSVQLNGDYNGVLAQTSSVFLFISNVLGYFPTDIFIVLNICLWSIVIIVIIRRLK